MTPRLVRRPRIEWAPKALYASSRIRFSSASVEIEPLRRREGLVVEAADRLEHHDVPLDGGEAVAMQVAMARDLGARRGSRLMPPSRPMWNREPLSAATEKHIAWMRQCVEGIASPFVSVGETAIDHGVTLRFADESAVTLNSYDREAPAALIARCTPAPFGDGAVTRVASEVRHALQHNAAGGAFAVEGLEAALRTILATVRADLCPRDPNPLRAELQSVNIYRRGGHFVRHKDTPHGDDMLGTLVL